ncbi:CubicO group peptidase (beta-lactamase class C family) [Bacillus ectoiniformans]|uniref:serine hydrolase domain-containing protein n=1 Tax=Bacillus ectoiniformans TaxID=1494429 RepID=UPI00195C634F|nr:serine hydrolase domain-containing protein [Bacillus ectoiniformans]MBM7648178.1 CubicO group peptidase (beta-lactamase class C family) [Bacillus ectoiniformans]
MKKFLKIFAMIVSGIIIISAAALLLFGRDAHSNLSGKTPEQIDQYLTNEGFQGAVLIAKDGEVLFEKGYGEAAPDVKNTPDTLYQIASLSKTFTATAVMQLAEKKLLSVDDPLSAYFPDFPNAKNITIGHLLSHSSGIPDYLNPEFEFDYGKKWDPNDIVDVVSDADLEFTRGESYAYSNTGYVLLGLIIEKVSGQSYAEYISEHIFKPAGMKNSMFEFTKEMPRAAGNVEGKPGPAMDHSAAYAAGDIISTAEDLSLFYKSLHNNELVSKETGNLMKATHAKKFPYQYGYGWYTQEVMGHKAVGHSGGYPSGFRHYVAHLQEEDLLVIVLSNEMSINSKAINRNLTSIVLKKPIWVWEKQL